MLDVSEFKLTKKCPSCKEHDKFSTALRANFVERGTIRASWRVVYMCNDCGKMNVSYYDSKTKKERIQFGDRLVGLGIHVDDFSLEIVKVYLDD